MNMGEAALCNVTEMSPQGGRGGQWARSWNVTTCPVMTLRVSIGVREEHAKVSAHLEAAADTSMAAANFSPQVNGAGEARFAILRQFSLLSATTGFHGHRGSTLGTPP
jgi:hypothetical protein